MRILQISSARHFGGGEKHLTDLIGGLRARGHDVFLAAPESSPFREGKLPGFPAENLCPLNVRHALDIAAARKLSQIIRGKNIEVVHAHVARDYVAAALAVRFNPRVKLVLTRHVLFPMQVMHRFALANVSRVIAVSQAVERALARDRIFPADRTVTIPNGIDTARWSSADHKTMRENFRREHGIAESDLLVGAVGELKKLKGQEDLIMAAEIVLQKFPAARFIVVGRDNAAGGKYAAHLRRMVTATGADENFTWLDWVDDTVPLAHALDVFVSASHSESFGLALLEAMAAGCAVAATETEGAKELLGEVKTLPVEQPLKLAAAIADLLGDAEKRALQGEKLQARAKEFFDLEKMVGETEAVYRELTRA